MSSALYDRIIDVTLTYEESFISQRIADTLAHLARIGSPIDVLKSLKTASESYQRSYKGYIQQHPNALKDAAKAALGGTGVKRNIKIACGNTFKPDIHVSLRELPDGNVVGMTCTIKNWALARTYDVRKFRNMHVRMGYRDGMIHEFDSTIFSAYCTKPSPDNEFVFKGVIVGEDCSGPLFDTDAQIEVELKGEKVTIYDLGLEICNKLNLHFQVDGIPEALLQVPITRVQEQYVAESGYAVVTWYISLVKEYSKALTTIDPAQGGLTEDPHIVGVIDGDWLTLCGNTYVADDEKTIRKAAIPVRAVNELTFTGPALSLTAPWIPSLRPNSVFSVPTHYYQDQTGATGVLADTDLGRVANTKVGLFRAIIVDVDFGTVDSSNTMTVMAMPLKFMSQSMYNEEGKGAQELKTAQEIEDAVSKNEVIGEVISSGTEEPATEVDSGGKGLKTIAWAHPASTFYPIKGASAPGETDYDTLERIARKFFTKKGGKASVTVGRARLKKGAPDYLSDVEISPALLFPLVVISTLYASQSDPTNERNFQYQWDRQIKSPDAIYPGKVLAIPSVTVESFLKDYGLDPNVAKLYHAMSSWYRNLEDPEERRMKSNYAEKLEDIAKVLEWYNGN